MKDVRCLMTIQKVEEISIPDVMDVETEEAYTYIRNKLEYRLSHYGTIGGNSLVKFEVVEE